MSAPELLSAEELADIETQQRFAEVGSIVVVYRGMPEAQATHAHGLCRRLQDCYYSGGYDVHAVYVVENDALRLAALTTEASDWDSDDYATVTVRLDGAVIGSYRIDGRA